MLCVSFPRNSVTQGDQGMTANCNCIGTAMHCTIIRHRSIKGFWSGTVSISLGPRVVDMWLGCVRLLGESPSPFTVTGGSSRRDHAPHGTP